MTRPLRIQYPGATYHVTCRGNEQKEIYRDDEDRKTFLRILSQSLTIYSVHLHAYVLMENHFHLLVNTPLGNLAEFMRHFNITYTGAFNRRHKRVGHLYQGRYKSILVEQEAYLSVLSRYIHLNPIRTGRFDKSRGQEKIEYLFQYPWSSLPGYLDKRKQDVTVDYALVLAEYGGNTPKGRTAYRNQLLADTDEDLEVKSHIFSQVIIGGDAFVAWVREKFLGDSEPREQPSAARIKHYREKETILALIEAETGKDLKALKAGKGDLRRLAMDLLYRHGGLKGPEIGALFGIDYSAVSQERKRLREQVVNDRRLRELSDNLEAKLSTLKI